MRSTRIKISRHILSGLLGLLLFGSISQVTLANNHQGAITEKQSSTSNSDNSESPTASSSKTGKITQPDIIPLGATSNTKLYLPHNTSKESNMTYVQNRLLPGITTMIISLTGGLSLVFVIISGIRLLVSYADSSALENAKKTLTYALAGLVISGLSYAIVAIIASIKVDSTPNTTSPTNNVSSEKSEKK